MSHSREDVISAAGRLFARDGYHGTSMRDLGRELGLLGSSLYSHVEGKQELLVAVVERGAEFFQASADAALAAEGPASERLRRLIEGHLGVILDHRDEVRTYLNEARSLEPASRERIVAARDRYEQAFRTVLKEGVADGSFRADVDPKLAGIFVLSILNAVDRWYEEDGRLDRTALASRIADMVERGLRTG